MNSKDNFKFLPRCWGRVIAISSTLSSQPQCAMDENVSAETRYTRRKLVLCCTKKLSSWEEQSIVHFFPAVAAETSIHASRLDLCRSPNLSDDIHAKGNIELGGNICFGLLVIKICLKMFVTHDIQKELFCFAFETQESEIGVYGWPLFCARLGHASQEYNGGSGGGEQWCWQKMQPQFTGHQSLSSL